MGKIRIKTLGNEEEEKKQKDQAKKRRETKKLAKGVHGGERMVSMSPTEEEIEKETEETKEKEETQEEEEKKTKKTSDKPRAPKQHSKRYQDAIVKVDRNKRYTLADAISLLKDFGSTKFDSTVELHVNTIEKGLSGQVTLPHGSGKSIRVAIASPTDEKSLEKLLQEVEGGTINFDVLIAHPAAMARLAKVAKILGPRGLMPNPKSGTISDKPQDLAKKFAGGQTNFRTESQAPIIHSAIGKISFAQKDLEENIGEFLKAVGKSNIASVTLKSTMSPGIKIDFASLS